MIRNNINGDNFNDTLGEEDDSYMDSNEIVSRTKFPESWLWSDIKLPPCPESRPNWWVDTNLHTENTLITLLVPHKVCELFFDSVTPHQLRGGSLCKTQSQPGSLLELVCQELTVRIHPILKPEGHHVVLSFLWFVPHSSFPFFSFALISCLVVFSPVLLSVFKGSALPNH